VALTSNFQKPNNCKAIIKVMLIDDHALVRAGIGEIFKRTSNIRVLDECDNGLDAQSRIVLAKPDVILVDIEMPNMNGIEFTAWAKKNHPSIKVILLSSYDEDAYVLAGLKAGANGYVLKNTSPANLIRSVNDVYLNRESFDPSITKKVVSLITARENPHDDALSKREIQILNLVSQGQTNVGIGNALHISSRTVQGHLSKVFSKLGVATRASAVSKAVSLKYIEV